MLLINEIKFVRSFKKWNLKVKTHFKILIYIKIERGKENSLESYNVNESLGEQIHCYSDGSKLELVTSYIK